MSACYETQPAVHLVYCSALSSDSIQDLFVEFDIPIKGILEMSSSSHDSRPDTCRSVSFRDDVSCQVRRRNLAHDAAMERASSQSGYVNRMMSEYNIDNVELC